MNAYDDAPDDVDVSIIWKLIELSIPVLARTSNEMFMSKSPSTVYRETSEHKVSDSGAPFPLIEVKALSVIVVSTSATHVCEGPIESFSTAQTIPTVSKLKLSA